jgi:hypothetical protein
MANEVKQVVLIVMYQDKRTTEGRKAARFESLSEAYEFYMGLKMNRHMEVTLMLGEA